MGSIISLAWPVTLTSLLQVGLGLVNVVVLGHLGEDSLAAASLGNLYVNLFGNAPASGLATAVDTLAAQAFGARRMFRIGEVSMRAAVLLMVACVPSAAMFCFAEPVLLAMGQDAAIARLAASYCRWQLIALPATQLFETSKKYLQAQTLTLPPVLAAAAAIPVNALLALALTRSDAIGFVGGPIATGIATWLSLALVLAYSWRRERYASWALAEASSLAGTELASLVPHTAGGDSGDADQWRGDSLTGPPGGEAEEAASDSEPLSAGPGSARGDDLAGGVAAPPPPLQGGRAAPSLGSPGTCDPLLPVCGCCCPAAQRSLLRRVASRIREAEAAAARGAAVAEAVAGAVDADGRRAGRASPRAMVPAVAAAAAGAVRRAPGRVEEGPPAACDGPAASLASVSAEGIELTALHSAGAAAAADKEAQTPGAAPAWQPSPAEAASLVAAGATAHAHEKDVDAVLLRTWPGWSWSAACSEWGEFLSLGLPGAVMTTLEWGTFEVNAVFAGWLGVTELAAHSALSQTGAVAFMVPLGLAVASAVRIGAHMGAGRPGRAKAALGAAVLWGLLYTSLNALVLVSARQQWGYLFASEPRVADAVAGVMPIMAFFNVFDTSQAVMSGGVRGVGRQAVGAVANLVAYCGVGLAGSYALSTAAGLGLGGIWLGSACGAGVGCLLLLLALLLSDWGALSALAIRRAERVVPSDASVTKLQH
ncbi:hypothetical protein FNF27_07805 [Cafeteria roenbergensis]|uniref:Polysaccharide biosynthesis protein C-terminal domain-containing protein n=2 Tax=Cafeteria roenbergensis TaxID=33653 RepID=A0A5A8DK81_CAFRO|nr:hypothetical protein FNF27_07805 [Cafeteria roenbergensis]